MDTRAAFMSKQQALVARRTDFTFDDHDNQFKLAEIKYWNEIWVENWDGNLGVHESAIWLANVHSECVLLVESGKWQQFEFPYQSVSVTWYDFEAHQSRYTAHLSGLPVAGKVA